MYMKKLFTLACSVAMLNTFLLVDAQSQDTALAKIDQKLDVEEQKQKLDGPKHDLSPLEQPSVDIHTAPVEKFVLPFNSLEQKRSILNTKVGPNGEELMMEKDFYYYLDEHGNKVKVKLTELRDKPKHS
jgi:hypothetical protein